MNILGISGGVVAGNQDAAAALLIDGHLTFAMEEERLTRNKHAIGVLPINAVRAALDYSGLKFQDIDYIAFHTQYKGFAERLSKFFHHHFEYCPPIRLIDHHRAHAASAFYASGFKEAMIFTTDLSGDGISTTLSHGKENDIKTLRVFKKPQSLGIFYSIITQVLGFHRDNDEYKVMGMGAYGKATEDLSWLLKLENSHYVLNEDFIFKVSANQTNRSKQEPMYSDAFVNKIGFLRRKTDPYEEKHFNLAASAQQRLNEAAISLVKWLHKETGSSNLCIAGGVGLNCVMNQSLLALDEVENIFVQPAASDAGTALGAAYEVAIQEGEKINSYPGAYTGNEFSASVMKAEIENLGVNYREVSNPAELAAQAIADGKIIGWFQGRHEFGPRALGSRSILADTRNADMKDLINVRIKFREEFRPFAPSVLEEDTNYYFGTNGHAFPHMTVTNNVCSEHQNEIPAVVHEDNTSRIQTVNSDDNPLYHELISNFKKITGVPVILNTSFNVRGQAIVNTPTQAVGTLFGSGMDMAFIGPFLIEK